MSLREEARDWYDGAIVDLEEAFDALKRGRYNWALFAAHQAVEKALKAAIMVLKRARPPRTHDLTRLLAELDIEIPRELATAVSELSPYYTAARYPNAGLERPWEAISRETAERLVGAARRVVELVGRIASFESKRRTGEGGGGS